jgi:hypothetical protein
MKTPVHRDTRLDDLDAHEFERMLASKSWRIYTERIHLDRLRLVEACVWEQDEILLRRAQGGAEALRSSLAVPQILLSEMKNKPRKAE